MTLAIQALRLVVCTLALPMFLLNFLGVWSWVSKKCFPYFMKEFGVVVYNKQMASRKRELFSNLQEFAGPSGKLTLLEVGCGTGANFKFYPPGCRVTCIDPNPNFEKFLFKSVAENQHLQFERFVVAAGENMHQVADGSVDVVVCTLVLCSVNNQEKILREVHRVLRPVSDRCEDWLAVATMRESGPGSYHERRWFYQFRVDSKLKSKRLQKNVAKESRVRADRSNTESSKLLQRKEPVDSSDVKLGNRSSQETAEGHATHKTNKKPYKFQHCEAGQRQRQVDL